MSETILVIEDEDALRRALGSLPCERSGATVSEASLRASDAFEHLDSQTFDIVLCDIVLPDGQGFRGRGPRVASRIRHAEHCGDHRR